MVFFFLLLHLDWQHFQSFHFFPLTRPCQACEQGKATQKEQPKKNLTVLGELQKKWIKSSGTLFERNFIQLRYKKTEGTKNFVPSFSIPVARSNPCRKINRGNMRKDTCLSPLFCGLDPKLFFAFLHLHVNQACHVKPFQLWTDEDEDLHLCLCTLRECVPAAATVCTHTQPQSLLIKWTN